MCEAAYELAMRPPRAGTIVNVTVSPHHGMPAMAHTGAARAAVEALTRELAESWAEDGVAVARSRSGGSPPSHCASTPPSCGGTAAKTVPLQRLGEVEEYGWLVALLASPLGRSFSGSVVTLDGAADNWTGPWPPEGLVRDGEVPTEQRRSVEASPD